MVLKPFHSTRPSWQSGVHELCHSKSVMDKEIKIKLFLPRWRGNSDPIKLCMVTEVVRTIVSPQKGIHIRPTVSPLEGAENLGEIALPKCKPP